MFEFYGPIKWLHIGTVIASGALFFVRGMGVQCQQRWPSHPAVRYLSYGIDSTLLTAALMLVTMLPHGVFSNGWLTVKLLLIVCYVVLGSFALKRARTPRARLMSFIAALTVFAVIISIARAHDPLGALRGLLD
jgi:uncharacterized membrane protein SirB2